MSTTNVDIIREMLLNAYADIRSSGLVRQADLPGLKMDLDIACDMLTEEDATGPQLKWYHGHTYAGYRPKEQV